ncbi:hypothetical protein [Methanoculleus sp.]|uniref:hypothetical protein n=1 Tax=Methanoculleus sp. TaxID=90427 RepID=UPI001BD5D60E|nr:hypothetical protein [Methanoculleus sp.]
MPWVYIDRNGTERVVTSVTVPRHLHKFAKGEGIGLSQTLSEALEAKRELLGGDAGAAGN